MPTGRTIRRPSDDTRPRRSRDEDEPERDAADEPDDERSSRRSSTRPSRRSTPRARRDEEDEPRSSRRRGRDDDDDDDDGVRGGWGAWRDERARRSNFGEDFKVEYKRRYIIRILDDAPFAAFGEHWLDDMPQGKKKSYVCLGRDCPLCDVLNDQAKAKALFNVIEFVEEKKGREAAMTPKLKVWTIGSGVTQILEDYAEDQDMSPISDYYWQVSKSKAGNKGATTYQINKVKERDLWDDHGVEPLTDEEWEEFLDKRFDSTYVRRDSRETLEEIAEEYVND